MDLTSLKLIKMATTRMDHSAQRQKVLAQNIANADTPDYRAKDLKKLDFDRYLREPARVQVATTNAKHSTGTLPPQPEFRSPDSRRTFEVSPDGNKIVLEEQMEKVARAKAGYEMAVTLIERYRSMLKTVTKGGG